MDTSSVFQGRNPPKLFDEIKGCKECRFSFKSSSEQDHSLFDDGVMLMGPLVSRAYSPCSCCPNLMQNCDLPPPVKVFTGADKIVFNSGKPKHISKIIPEESGEVATNKMAQESDKLDLMKALRLSQSRARTAEKKASLVTEERDRLHNLFLKESFRLFAHRQWLKLLQLEISHLRPHKQKMQTQAHDNHNNKPQGEKGLPEAEPEDGENADSLIWCMTLALCLSIAGVGVAVGYRYML